MPGTFLRFALLTLALMLQWLLPQPARSQDAGTVTQRVVSVAELRYIDPRLGLITSRQSNTVIAVAPVIPPAITFFSTDAYDDQALMSRSGHRLYVQIKESSCNRDPLVEDRISVTMKSVKAKAVDTYTAVETAPNSGIFRIPGGVTTYDPTVRGAVDVGQEVLSGDSLQATVAGCNGRTLETAVQMDPGGVVFDSATGLPVAGARVKLIDVTGAGNGGSPGAPAAVWGFDGKTVMANDVVTGADGVYTFPQVVPSDYRLEVTPPAAYAFPSTVARSQLPGSYEVVDAGSYGQTFPVNASTGAVVLDLPLDPLPRSLFVQMTASRTSAEIAETVEYLVTIKNVGQVALDAVQVGNNLPAGFAYLPGSARLDGVAIADPTGGRGPSLGFVVGAMPASSTKLLRYRVRLGAGAMNGDGITRVQAHTELPAPTLSNVASARVKVEAGVFSDKAIVLGTVFADCNANGVKDENEIGVPGVRLVMEDGTFVVTDGAGRYSLYGLSPRTHVLKIDATSLPEGAVPLATSQRHAGDGASRFVDAHRGELERADFALDACTPALQKQLRDRQKALGERELGTALKTDLKAGAPTVLGDLRSLPAQGLVGETNRLEAPVVPAGAAPSQADPAMAASMAQPLPEQAAPADAKAEPAQGAALDSTLDFVDWRDGQTVGSLPQALRIKGRLGATISLQVNGVAVGEDRIGQRSTSAEAQAEIRDYVGVQLRRGDNVLTLSESDPFGHVRATRTLHVVVPGELARIVVTPAQARADADGQSRVAVRVELQDERGLPIAERLQVTLNSSIGQWDSIDVDSQQPGVQTFIEGGVGQFALFSPATPGQADLTVKAGAVTGQASVAFVPALRPMLAVGVIEGALNLRKLDPKSLVPARSDDGFETELREFAGNGEKGAGARAALFLKGKVRGDYLLTLGYDSDKPASEGLFRDIQPDAFYPVYGDSSVRGFDAQSTGRLYVRVEKERSYLLYGDFTTQSSLTGARQLGAYQRSLNGIKEHYENDRVAANVFASHDSTRQMQDELRADGTSGPFARSGGEIVENSEKAGILVPDRNQPAIVLKTTPMARFTDYEIDALSGRLLFRAPIASLDADLNPVSIRITYEIDQQGPAFWVAGVDAQVKVTEQIEVGGSYVKDFNPLQPFQLQSFNSSYKFAEETVLTGEVARTEHELTGSGSAERVELQHAGTALKARVFAARSELGFDNTSATISNGRSEGGAKISYALDERTRLLADALHSGDILTGSHRDGVLLGAERSFDGGTKLEVGTRLVREVAAVPNPVTGEQSGETRTVRAKLTTVVPGLPMATAFVEAEQDVREHDKRLLALGGDYQIAGSGRVYLRHELISSLSGPYALDATQRRNTTVLGIDAEVMDEGRLFSEYRGRDAFEGRSTEAAVGLRNRWTLAEGLRLNTSFERVQVLTGDSTDPATAVTGAIEYTANPLWKGTARLEARDGLTTRSVLSTLGLARKLDADWTFLGKNIYAMTQDKTGQPNRVQERLQVGVAYRDSATNRVNALGRYEFKQERGNLGDEGSRAVHIVSTHGDWQPRRELTLSGHLAAKWVNETLDGQPARANAQLLSLRAVRDISTNWDVGVAASMLASDNLKSRQSAVGAEAGYQVQKNLWVSAGYNVSGFHDRDLSSENYTNRGVYVRLRFKFDENIFGRKPT